MRMRTFSSIAVLALVLLTGCQLKTGDQQDFSHLEGCEHVQDMQMTSLYGAANLRVTQVTYEGYGSYSTSMPFHTEEGETVGIPFCYGKGDVTFSLEVVPMGPSRDASFDNEVVLRFGPHQWADMDISWDGMLQDSGPTVSVQSLTSNGEAEYFTVTLRWHQL